MEGTERCPPCSVANCFEAKLSKERDLTSSLSFQHSHSLHGTPAEKETWWPQVTLSALCAKASGIYTAFLCCAPTPRLQPPQYTSTAANALTHLQPHKAQVGQLPAMTPTTSWASSSSQVDAEASNWEIDRTHTNWASGLS